METVRIKTSELLQMQHTIQNLEKQLNSIRNVFFHYLSSENEDLRIIARQICLATTEPEIKTKFTNQISEGTKKVSPFVLAGKRSDFNITTNMNTRNIGDSFEMDVFNHLKKELENERLPISGKNSKIFSKKGYYSRDREKNIIIDVSIETFLPQATNYSLLTVIECKNYKGTISVDAIEEFYSKVQQIAGCNVKAVFATNSRLQRSAYAFANSKKIGIIRYLPTDAIRCLNHTEASLSLFEKSKPNSYVLDSTLIKAGHHINGKEYCEVKSPFIKAGQLDNEMGCCVPSYDDAIFTDLLSLLKQYLNEEDNNNDND